MAISFCQPTGLVNLILGAFGVAPQSWLDMPDKFPMIYTIINVWKSFGFNSILYFSTLSAIDPSLYESARIDGGNRWQQCWHITLPGLKSIIAIQFILALGGILNTNSDLVILIYNPATYETADVMVRIRTVSVSRMVDTVIQRLLVSSCRRSVLHLPLLPTRSATG